MIPPDDVPPVGSDEILARFVLRDGWIRKSDNSVRSDAFMPPPNGRFSVTRHLLATEPELWSVGRSVAEARQLVLHGRADLSTASYARHDLVVAAAQVPGNPNHADVCGWPQDKAAVKAIALALAEAARFVPLPAPV